GASRATLLDGVAADDRAHRAHVDDRLAGTEACDQTIGAISDALQRSRGGDHHENHVSASRNIEWSRAPRHPFVEQPLRLRLRTVVTNDRVAFGEEAFDHPAAHGAEADISEVCHNADRAWATVSESDPL